MEASGTSVCLEDLNGASWVVENMMEHTPLSFLALGLGKWGQALQSVLECSLVYFSLVFFQRARDSPRGFGIHVGDMASSRRVHYPEGA